MSSEHSIINSGLTLVFVAYSIFVIIMAIWGHSIIPVNCENGEARYALRGLLVSGFVSLTAFISYGLCNLTCKIRDPVILPNWFILIGLALSIANLVLANQVLNGLASSKVCQSGSYNTYKQVMDYFNGSSAIVLIISIILTGKRGYDKLKEMNTKVSQKAMQVQKQQSEAKSKVDVEKLEKEAVELEKQSAELERQQRAKDRYEQAKKGLEERKKGRAVLPSRQIYGRSRWDDMNEAPW